jgi:integrase
MYLLEHKKSTHEPWNKGKLVGQKTALKRQEIRSIRIRLELMLTNQRDVALFNLALDSKLRCCDLVKLKVKDVTHGTRVLKRTMIIQQKTSQPVQFEITKQTRDSLEALIHKYSLVSNDYLFGSRVRKGFHFSTRQYQKIVKMWVSMIGLEECYYGTHTMRRTKASLIYKRTKNLRAVQLLLGHTKLESTVRYLGIEVEDALEMAELLAMLVNIRGSH